MRHHHISSRPHVQRSPSPLRLGHSASGLTDGAGLVLLRRIWDQYGVGAFRDARAAGFPGRFRSGLRVEVWVALLLYGSAVMDDLHWFRGRGVRELFGWKRVPDPTTFGRWLRRAGSTLVPVLDGAIWHLVRSRWAEVGVPEQVTLVLDSRVAVRYGAKQAGAEKGKYLDELQVPWKESHPAHIESGHGTHLVVTRLRDRWTPDRFQKLRLGLARLISPTLRDHFRIQIEINGAKELIEPVVGLDEAMYSIKGHVDSRGHCLIRYSDLSGVDEAWERTVVWPEDNRVNCGPLDFRIAAWDLDSVPLRHFLKETGKKVGLREFRRVIRDHSGVSLYRDEFRILPYGESDNDWLRLDRRRVNNPTMRLSNNQILGSVHLTADGNPELRDQTNREGLVTNDAYAHLQEVVLELLGYLETRRFAARRSMDLDWQRRTSSLPALDPSGSDVLSRILDGLGAGNGSQGEAAEEIRRAFTGLRESSAEVIRHYAGLASSGQLSGIVFRQLRHPIRQIRSDLDLALNDLDQGGSPDAEMVDDLRESLRAALQHLETMTTRMDRLDPLASGGRGRRVSEVVLSEVLRPVVEAFADEFDRAGVALDFLSGDGDKVRTNPEVSQQVLANLFDNALHWATRADAETPAIHLRLTPSGFVVWDTGPGIPEKHRRLVFEPHFTTREDSHGLGLTLVKDLLKTIGGRIRLTDPGSARFEVVLDHESE